MEIRFRLSNEQKNLLFKKCGYVTEKVLTYYSNKYNPYGEEDYSGDGSGLHPFEKTIAYKEGERPEELNKEYPLLKNLEDFYEINVIERLVSEILFDVVINH